MPSNILQRLSRIRRELVAVSLGFGVFLLLFSLLSYHPGDMAMMEYGRTQDLRNLFGVLGAWLSHALFQLAGVGAFWIPCLSILFIARYTPRQEYPRRMIWLNAAGSLLLIASTGGFFGLWGETVHPLGVDMAAAGHLGGFLRDPLVRYFGRFGGGLFLLLGWLAGMMLATNVTIDDLVTRLGPAARRTAGGLRSLIRRIMDRGRTLSGIFSENLKPSRRTAVRSFPPPLVRVDALPSRPVVDALPYHPEPTRQSTPPPADQEPVPEPFRRFRDNPLPDEEAIPEVRPLGDGDFPETPWREPEPAAPVTDAPPWEEEPVRTRPFRPFPSSNAGSAMKDRLSVIRPAKRPPGGPGGGPRRRSPADATLLPPLSFLKEAEGRPSEMSAENLERQSRLLEEKLRDFGVEGMVTAERPGPVITTFEYKPAPGVKINKIVNLSDDLALGLKALSIRIVAPIPGKDAIGIEIPNPVRETVRFREVVDSDVFRDSPSRLTVCLGKDIEGTPVVAELDKMPHLLIAGATGTGKSVGLNAMICSLLYKATYEEVKLIMVDPKRIELSLYNGIPHLITPVVTDVKKATNALFWAVGEMERRYTLLSDLQVRNIGQYNDRVAENPDIYQENGEPHEHLPYIVIIIDELADLMMVASRDVEVALMRLAQMARAAGIHLILATQRPSVDVLTGVIKANFPTRLSFQVSSKTDSRTIIDGNGAEKLLGKGDMLFLPPGTAKIQRIQGAYISEDELGRVTEFLKTQKAPEYDASVVEGNSADREDDAEEEYDERYDEAVALVVKSRQASISMIQRRLRIGYNRAARIVEIMEREGIVGPGDGAKPREVLARDFDEEE